VRLQHYSTDIQYQLYLLIIAAFQVEGAGHSVRLQHYSTDIQYQLYLLIVAACPMEGAGQNMRLQPYCRDIQYQIYLLIVAACQVEGAGHSMRLQPYSTTLGHHERFMRKPCPGKHLWTRWYDDRTEIYCDVNRSKINQGRTIVC
jgi:hypothetical protein